MKQIRLFILEEIIYCCWKLMPKGREKELFAELLVEYSALIAHELKKDLVKRGKFVKELTQTESK